MSIGKDNFSRVLEMDDKLIITGTIAAHAMGMHTTRLLEHARRGEIQFPYQMSGEHRMKIPRIPFLKYWGITDEEIANRKLNDQWRIGSDDRIQDSQDHTGPQDPRQDEPAGDH